METTQTHHGRHLLICCAIGFVCFLGAYMRVPVLPLFAAEIGASTTQVGLINASFMLSAGLLAIPFGLMSDRIGRQPMLLGGMLVLTGSSLLIPLSSGPLQMAAVYLLFGAGLAAFTPTMMSVIADVAPRSHLGRAYSWYTTAVYVGMTFGPAAGGFLGRSHGLRTVFYAAGALTFAAFLMAVAFLPKTGPVLPGAEGHPSLARSLIRIFPNRQLLAGLTGTLGGCFGFGMFISFLPLHAQAQGLNASHVGMVFAAQALANALLRIPFGSLSDRVDRGGLAVAGLLFFAVALAATGFGSGVVSLALCGVGIGIGMCIGFSAIGALVADVVPKEQRGLAMGLYNSCIYLGMMLSSATMGWVIHHTGFRTGFMLAGAFTLALTLAFFLLTRRPARPEER